MLIVEMIKSIINLHPSARLYDQAHQNTPFHDGEPQNPPEIPLKYL